MGQIRGGVVTLTFASWNRIADWLNRIQALQTAAYEDNNDFRHGKVRVEVGLTHHARFAWRGGWWACPDPRRQE